MGIMDYFRIQLFFTCKGMSKGTEEFLLKLVQLLDVKELRSTFLIREKNYVQQPSTTNREEMEVSWVDSGIISFIFDNVIIS
jgi:hypothetical protein